MLKLLPVTLSLLILAAAIPAASLQGGNDSDPAQQALRETQAELAQYAGLVAAFPQGAGLSEQLVRAASLTVDGAAPPVPAVTFEDAMARLYAAAGIATPATLDAPPADVAAAVAPVIAAIAEASLLTDEAFSGLAPEDKTFLLANLDVLAAPQPGEDEERLARIRDLASQVDAGKIAQGASLVSAAMDAVDAISTPMTTWIDPSGMIEIGSTSNDCYYVERVLIVDLAGNDCYDNYAATATPTSPIALPVSVILDLAGNDYYTTSALHPSSATSTWGQAVGIGGIGIIADRWGDDTYVTQLYDQGTECAYSWLDGNRQIVYAQAVGLLGVGAIADLSGNDHYYAFNTNTVQNYCHFGWAYTYAQAAGLTLGVGLLADDTGDDTYYAYSYSQGKADNSAAVFAQAVAVGGIAVLADKEGSDFYYASAIGLVTFNYVKGAFAYVFAQAATAATRFLPAATLPLLGPAMPTTPFGLPVPCLAGDKTNPDRSQARCDLPGVAVLVDVLGDDSFDIAPYMDDIGQGCWNGGWAIGSGQGSAAYGGLATLVNVDVEGSDSFTIHPYANGAGCGGPGTRAHAYGQGHGGPVVWNFWEPPVDTAIPVGVGILVSLGIPQPECSGGGASMSDLDCAPFGLIGPAPQLWSSPDRYQMTADALGSSPYSWMGPTAATIVGQGAGNDRATSPITNHRAIGVGVNVDSGGHDFYSATANAQGKAMITDVLAQGAANGNTPVALFANAHTPAIGILTNVGGDDTYKADAYENGVPQPSNTRVQGWADGAVVASVPPMLALCFSFGFCLGQLDVTTALGVFVDIAGNDGYSEAAERFGCMPNGATTGTWPVGVPLDTVWWGHVLGNPCPAPTPDVGSGTAIGLDWASDVSY